MKIARGLCIAIVTSLMVLAIGHPAAMASEQVLYRFCRDFSCTDGSRPEAGLVMYGAGNLYGTTSWGGNTNGGVVFQLSPAGTGFAQTVLHHFCSRSHPVSCADGGRPYGTLIMDAAGSLYGTGAIGGTHGLGVAFRLSPTNKESVLHNFGGRRPNGSSDGASPKAGLVADEEENLYGTTSFGGRQRNGTVFQLSRTAGGVRETVLHDFCARSDCADGSAPYACLVTDGAGNLYGTTSSGGNNHGGVVFQLSPTRSGWKETVLHHFCADAGCADGGSYPQAGLIIDGAGNLFGTTVNGGTQDNGVVFKLSRTGTGWQHTVLYRFCSETGCADGRNPAGGVIMDGAGNLYGTTQYGGAATRGVVFKLTPDGAETVLYSFCSTPNCSDGANPVGDLVMDGAGNLYGTTFAGGTSNDGMVFHGVVFQITP